MDIFNDVLLEKQGCRLLNNESSFVAKVLKPKYFPLGDSLLITRLRTKPLMERDLACKNSLHGRFRADSGEWGKYYVWGDASLFDGEGKHLISNFLSNAKQIYISDQ